MSPELTFPIKFRRLPEGFLVVLFMLWHGASQAQSPDFSQAQLIQSISWTVGQTRILLSHPLGGEMLAEQNKSVVITARGGVFVFKYSSTDEQWLVDDTLSLSKSTTQRRRLVKSPDERCLFASGDGGEEGYEASLITSLCWEGEKLVLGPEQSFNGVVELAVSPESTFLVACSPKSGVMRVYRIKGCSLEKPDEFASGSGRYGFLEGCHSLTFRQDGRFFCVGGNRHNQIGCFRLNGHEGWLMAQELSQYEDNEWLKDPMGLAFLNDMLYIVLKNGIVVAFVPRGGAVTGESGFIGQDHGIWLKGRRVYPKTNPLEGREIDLQWRPFSEWGLITPVNNNTLLISDSTGIHAMELVKGFLEFRKTIVQYAGAENGRVVETGVVSSPRWVMVTNSANDTVTLFSVMESSAESVRSFPVSIYMLLPLMLGHFY